MMRMARLGKGSHLGPLANREYATAPLETTSHVSKSSSVAQAWSAPLRSMATVMVQPAARQR